jgi:hypothetical protein
MRTVSFQDWVVKKHKAVNVQMEIAQAQTELFSLNPQIQDRARKRLVYLQDASSRGIRDGVLVLFFTRSPLIVSKDDWLKDAVNNYHDDGVRRRDVNRSSTNGVV